jgi:hypothetical protein
MAISNDCVSIIKNGDSTLVIRCNRDASYFTLEDVGGDSVVIFKNSINNIIREIQKLKELNEPTGVRSKP